MPVHDVGHASIVSTKLLVGVSVGVVPFTRLGCVLPNIEGSDVFVKRLSKKSVRVYGFTGRDSSIRWAICLSVAG